MALDENGRVRLAKTPTEARQGFMLGRMRWVLGISLVLIIVGLVVAYVIA